MPKESTNKDTVSESDIKNAILRDKILGKYGYSRPQEEVYMQHPSGARIKLNLAMYDTFVCVYCKKPHAFLLPKDASPCYLHSDNICCNCCMRQGMSTYCMDKATSYVMEM